MPITFFVELADPAIEALFDARVVESLHRMRAAVAIAMLDLSEGRRRAIATLNRAGVPVTAWLVVDEDDGYWLSVDNPQAALARYDTVHRWAQTHQLQLRGIGLDIELPLAHARALVDHPAGVLLHAVASRRSRTAIREAAASYAHLVERARADGYHVETYQFPLIIDERRTTTTILSRVLGLVDVTADLEVLMLYRNMLPGLFGHWLVELFGADAQAIAVGITGGGVDFVLEAGVGDRLVDYPQLVRELRRARYFTDNLYVFSLEGCVAQGYLDKLSRTPLPALPPPALARALLPIRWAGRALLRLAERLDGRA